MSKKTTVNANPEVSPEVYVSPSEEMLRAIIKEDMRQFDADQADFIDAGADGEINNALCWAEESGFGPKDARLYYYFNGIYRGILAGSTCAKWGEQAKYDLWAAMLQHSPYDGRTQKLMRQIAKDKKKDKKKSAALLAQITAAVKKAA